MNPFDKIREQFRAHTKHIERTTRAIQKNADGILARQIVARIREIIDHPDPSYRWSHESELRQLRRKLWRIEQRQNER